MKKSIKQRAIELYENRRAEVDELHAENKVRFDQERVEDIGQKITEVLDIEIPANTKLLEIDGGYPSTYIIVEDIHFTFDEEEDRLYARASDKHEWYAVTTWEELGQNLLHDPMPPRKILTIGQAQGKASAFADSYNNGLTKREYFAALAMQGSLFLSQVGSNQSKIASCAVAAADALLEELHKEEPITEEN